MLVAHKNSPVASEIYHGAHRRSFEKNSRKRREWLDRIIAEYPEIDRAAFNIEARPIRRSISDIARCLHFAVYGRYLEPNFRHDVAPIHADFILPIIKGMPVEAYNIGDPSVFTFRSWELQGGPDDVMWHFEFYGGVNFHVLHPETRRILFPPQPNAELTTES